MNTNIGFKSPMFVYAAESGTNPSSLKVIIPEAFLTDKNVAPLETKSQKGNMSIFLNATPPAISPYTNKYNYITLPIIGSGLVNVNKGDSRGSYSSGIGEIHTGDRLIAQFVNDNPRYGIIIGRC